VLTPHSSRSAAAAGQQPTATTPPSKMQSGAASSKRVVASGPASAPTSKRKATQLELTALMASSSKMRDKQKYQLQVRSVSSAEQSRGYTHVYNLQLISVSSTATAATEAAHTTTIVATVAATGSQAPLLPPMSPSCLTAMVATAAPATMPVAPPPSQAMHQLQGTRETAASSRAATVPLPRLQKGRGQVQVSLHVCQPVIEGVQPSLQLPAQSLTVLAHATCVCRMRAAALGLSATESRQCPYDACSAACSASCHYLTITGSHCLPGQPGRERQGKSCLKRAASIARAHPNSLLT
jgi:hypothetical protein